MGGAFGLALMLCGLAGWVDAVGVAHTGGVFLSFMSGNTTDLAIALMRFDQPRAVFIAAVIPLFVGGVVMGEAIDRLAGTRTGPCCVLGAEAAALACGAALYPDNALAYPLVLAMGIQNTAIHRTGGVRIGLTFVTGTLVQLGRCLAAGDLAKALQYAAVWLSLALGAAGGAFTLSQSQVVALIAPAVFAACMAAVAAVVRIAQPAQAT